MCQSPWRDFPASSSDCASYGASVIGTLYVYPQALVVSPTGHLGVCCFDGARFGSSSKEHQDIRVVSPATNFCVGLRKEDQAVLQEGFGRLRDEHYVMVDFDGRSSAPRVPAR